MTNPTNYNLSGVFKTQAVAQIDAFYRERAITASSRIPNSQFVKIHEIENQLLEEIDNGVFKLDWNSASAFDTYSATLSQRIRKTCKEFENVLNNLPRVQPTQFISDLLQTIFKENYLYCSIKGITNEIKNTFNFATPFVGKVTCILTERGSILGELALSFTNTSTVETTVLLADRSALCTHKYNRFQQVWSIQFVNEAGVEENLRILGVKDTENEQVIVFSDLAFYGTYNLTDLTHQWFDINGKRSEC